MATSVQWTDLPDDLLQVVYLNVGSFLHRVRFAAVCSSWRAVAITARHAAPPTLPWLIFPSLYGDDCKTMHAYCPEDGRVLHIPLKSEALVGKRLVGANGGGWVAALGKDKQLDVVNVFSGVELLVHAKNMRNVYSGSKVVFSKFPVSSDCILATTPLRSNIAVCKIGCLADRWTTYMFNGHILKDIVFYNGRLYGLTASMGLIKFNIGVNKYGRPLVAVEVELCIQIDNEPFIWSTNIVELRGKLAMVLGKLPLYNNCHEPFFKVFVLADESTTKYACKWEEVTSLGDCALFLGKMSRAVDVPAVGLGRVQRNHIYADDMTYLTSLGGNGNRVYPMQDESSDDVTQRIKLAGSYVAARAQTGLWVLPLGIWVLPRSLFLANKVSTFFLVYLVFWSHLQ
ncbi:hypothetical protein CFC21_090757 [Triticum aestivum]|uniref:KIB1-4 beta-propeller domain-containing protein n=2 Tax=Triticum aestivum TaxID=4565 RepID=A0A9R1MSA9_WHEAT|nr:hypothetical protein CFC21_090757 [Triticum aestivum]